MISLYIEVFNLRLHINKTSNHKYCITALESYVSNFFVGEYNPFPS